MDNVTVQGALITQGMENSKSERAFCNQRVFLHDNPSAMYLTLVVDMETASYLRERQDIENPPSVTTSPLNNIQVSVHVA